MALKTTTNFVLVPVCVLFFALNVIVVHSDELQVPLKEQACGYWKRMAQEMSNKSSQMFCVANSTDPCTQLDCQGTYKYRSWVFPTSAYVEIDFCFGITLNHCDEPISLDIYLQIPAKNVTYNSRVMHDELMKIPGGSFTTATVGKVEAYLYFHMKKNGSFVNFSMTIKLKITTLGNLSVWPQGLQRVLVPEEKIPVPPCNNTNTVASTPKPPPVCRPPHWRQKSGESQNPNIIPTGGPSVTYNKTCNDTMPCAGIEACNQNTKLCECYPHFNYNAKERKCKTKSLFGKSCKIGGANECGIHEQCKMAESEDNEKGKCTCIHDTIYNQLEQICTYIDNNPINSWKPDAAGNKGAQVEPLEKNAGNATAVIAGCVTAVIILAGVLVVVFVLLRRRRSQYDRRILLINEDDDPLAM